MRQSMKDFFKRVKMDAILSAILCIVYQRNLLYRKKPLTGFYPFK